MHKHTIAMCLHRDQPNMWHAACVDPNCPEDHWVFEAKLHRVACAYCGNTQHFPIDCPLPPHMRTGINVGNAIHINK